MSTKNVILGSLGLVVLGAVALATSAYAYQGVPMRNGAGQRINAERGAGLEQGRGMMNGNRGQNRGGNFVDANGDGICDHMQ